MRQIKILTAFALVFVWSPLIVIGVALSVLYVGLESGFAWGVYLIGQVDQAVKDSTENE